MNQVSIISDLVKWIEANLEQPLSIDHVAKKSGYSKWHLQRMFKEVSGQVLGTYIRHRRLTHVALALRMTSKPILDIAMQYRFDSQQTLTRSFKKQFNVTPACYRRNDFWDPSGLTPPINLDKTTLSLPEPTIIEMPTRTFWGITYRNTSNLNKLLSENFVYRKQFFTDYFSDYSKNNSLLPDRVYAIAQVKKSDVNAEEQELLYTIAVTENMIKHAKKFVHSGGSYICFKYVGSPQNFVDFVRQVHLAAMPALKMKLRKDGVMEIHHNRHNIVPVEGGVEVEEIECDYCLPIVVEDNITL